VSPNAWLMPHAPVRRPPYSAEDACAIIALACEDPYDSGRAITHWTQRELAAEAIKRGIAALGWAHFNNLPAKPGAFVL